MATIKVTSNKSGSTKKLIKYLTKEEKTKEELISGKDCNPDNAVNEFLATKYLYNKTEKRQHYHFVQSFKPGEITPEKAHKIGKELAEQFKGYQVFVCTHTDKEHIHNHIVVNSVNFENGKKFHWSKHNLENFKKENDKICEREGLDIIKEKKGGYLSQAQLKTAERGENYQLRLIGSIRKIKQEAISKEDYINKMNIVGYKVKWDNDRGRKRITYIDKKYEEELENKGKSTVKSQMTEKSLSKYGIPKDELTKEALENEFRRNAREESEREIGGNKEGHQGEERNLLLRRDDNIKKHRGEQSIDEDRNIQEPGTNISDARDMENGDRRGQKDNGIDTPRSSQNRESDITRSIGPERETRKAIERDKERNRGGYER